ncbi:MAG: AraC family transcriptional regulator [Cyanobacteria bacterium P01_A01_bin.114]
MTTNPLETLSTQPAISKRSLRLETGLTLHYRHDQPGELAAPEGLSHHLLTFFLTANSRQVTRIDAHGEHDGQMSQGEFYLFPADRSGHTHWHSVDKTFHIMIEPGRLRRVAQETGWMNSDRVELRPILKGRDRNIEHLTQLLLLEVNNREFAQKLYIDSLSSALCIHLLRQYCTVKVPSQKGADGLPRAQLNQILDYIRAHLHSDLRLVTLADQIGISRYYFASLFKQSMQITPHQYVNQQRVEKAKQLLRAKQLSLAEIALDCGFSSQSHLTKVFRQYTATTPKAYQTEIY